MAKLQSFDVSIGLPFELGKISGTWEPDEAERTAAWELYVELVTRISVVELAPEDGLLREAMTSLHSLFDITRLILRTHGPDLAPDDKFVHFGHLAVSILNFGVRPYLAKWHPILAEHEAGWERNTSARQNERSWPDHDQARDELADVQETLRTYASLLGRVCGAEGLLGAATRPTRGPVGGS